MQKINNQTKPRLFSFYLYLYSKFGIHKNQPVTQVKWFLVKKIDKTKRRSIKQYFPQKTKTHRTFHTNTNQTFLFKQKRGRILKI